MQTINQKVWLSIGTVLAALGASVCCILPVAVVVLGVGSAALGAKLETFRPYFLGLTVVLLVTAFYQVYTPKSNECAPGESCAVPENRRRQRMVVWIIAVLALALVSFPYYVNWVL